MLEQYIPEGLHCVVSTHAGAVLGELQPMRRIHIGAVHEGLPPLGRTMLENVTE